MQPNPPDRPAAVDASRLTADQVPPGMTSGAVTASNLLALSGERDLWLARVLGAERRGYRRGLADGIGQGRRLEAAELAASWHAFAEPIAHPERGAGRRIQAAVAGERRDQAAHERSFVARAYNTHDRDRTDVQRAAVLAYPPPAAARRSA